jgi:hypothetical protein
MIRKIIQWFKERKLKKQRKLEFDKKMEELKKRDPFIYKH